MARTRKSTENMLSRTATSSIAGRGSSMRRMRRRSSAASAAYRPYCGTNGCTSFLIVDVEGRSAHCPICGFERRMA
jgi:hypothetical protein